MNKEPIGLYIFRFILGLGLFAFMAMLYWSSLLLEEDMRAIRMDVAQIKVEMTMMQSAMDKTRADIMGELLHFVEAEEDSPEEASPSTAKNQANSATIATTPQNKPPLALGGLTARPHLDATLPNLLGQDPFYAVVLPKLLGKNFKPHGTFHQALVAKPDNLHPFTNWGEVSTWLDLCNVSVSRSQFGIYETFCPNMAIKVESRQSKAGLQEYWVHLRDGVYWQPLRQDYFSEQVNLAPHFLKKHQVTASDFKFYFDAVMNPSVQEEGAVAMRNFIGDIQEFEVIDPLTFVVRWKMEKVTQPDGEIQYKPEYVSKLITGGLKPLASFVYQYFPDGTKIIEDDSDKETYRTNSVWAQNFSQHWAKNIIPSCGPWIFDGMTERLIRFKRNPDHYFPLDVLFDKQEVAFKDSPSSVWQEFKLNQLETYTLRPDQLPEYATFTQSSQYKDQVANGAAIKRIDYVARRYTFIGWNEAKPYFTSKNVRRALTMAIDRARIIRQNLNGMGIEITGPFYPYSTSHDPSIEPWPYDPRKARALLAEEGWYDSNGDGIIDKEIDGKRVPFQFNLTYFVKEPIAKAIAEYVATSFKEIGIICNLNGVDVADLTVAFNNKSFDALLMAWSLGTPPEDVKQLWYSAGDKEKGSSNVIGFANAKADALIDLLQYEADPKKRIALYHQFDAIIHDEAPYTFLYTPKSVMLYREYVQNVFLPIDRQDLVPGANVAEPDSSIYWIKQGGF